MAAGYLHVEVTTVQTPRSAGSPCGDVVVCDRTAAATTLIVADGLGSGVRANLAAELASARLAELLRGGMSLRRAVGSLAKSMNQARQGDDPYPFAAFGVARILNDGNATVLTYEMPPPLLVSRRQVAALEPRTQSVEAAMMAEFHAKLVAGDGLLMVSDGVTQAGLGKGLAMGWEIDGVQKFASQCLARGIDTAQLPAAVHAKALELTADARGDDTTAALAMCRRGVTVRLMTGPPGDRARDREVARQFLAGDDIKILCGASTAGVVGRYLGHDVDVEQDSRSMLAPPRYTLDGVELVTEGAVTLNQVYNVLDESPDAFEEVSGVTDLYELLTAADRVELWIGSAANPANSNISFRQRGILSRRQIVPLIADKLRAAGKLVVVRYV
jgi:hypothetical protein